MRDSGLEIRIWWLVLGGALLLLIQPLRVWLVFAFGLPWLALSWGLHHRTTRPRVAAMWRHVVATPGGRTVLALSLLILGGLAGPGIGLMVGLWALAITTGIGLWRGPGAMREALNRGILFASALALCLVIAEGLLRWEPVSSQLGSPGELAKWNERYDRLWERNALGIRSPYEVLEKRPGVTRVVALGDSFTWGDKIARSDSTWPAQLEVALAQLAPEGKFEVVNLGQKGFTTVNEAEMLRRVGWQFHPDLVILQFFANDILPSGPNYQRESTAWLIPQISLIPGRFRTDRLRRSATLHFLERRINSLVYGSATWTERFRALYEERGDEWLAMVSALEEMGAEAGRRDVPIILLIFPRFFPGEHSEASYPIRDLHADVAEVAAAAGYRVLDLVPVYAERGGDWSRWWATPYDSHPSAEAAGVAAHSAARLVLSSIENQTGLLRPGQ